MTQIEAVLVNHSAPGLLDIRKVSEPVPASSEAIVQVAAVGLSLDELLELAHAPEGQRFGHEFVGRVERRAADGSGPEDGCRVAGIIKSGACAERIAVPTNSLARVPSLVPTAYAAALPVAGLTAIRALAKGGFLLKRKVLITNAEETEGYLACQIARSTGAEVTAIVSHSGFEVLASEAGAHHVLVGNDAKRVEAFGPFHLIIDSIGGEMLSTSLKLLEPGGVCVSIGTTKEETRVDTRQMDSIGGVNLFGFSLSYDLVDNPAQEDLKRLLNLVVEQQLSVRIAIETTWNNLQSVAEKVASQRIIGKAVLHVSSINSYSSTCSQ